MRLPSQKILSNVRGLLVAFVQKHPVFIRFSFCQAFSLPVQHQRKSVYLGSTNKKNQAVPEIGTAWFNQIIPDMKDTDFGNFLHPEMKQANDGNQLRHMQNVRHGCRLASK
jgi:hypothetical protein